MGGYKAERGRPCPFGGHNLSGGTEHTQITPRQDVRKSLTGMVLPAFWGRICPLPLPSSGHCCIFGVLWPVDASTPISASLVPWSSPCVTLPLCLSSSPYKDTNYTDKGPILLQYELTTSVTNYICFKSGHIPRSWGLRLPRIFFGDTIQSI